MFHKIVPRPRFIRVLDCDRILVVHTQKCASLGHSRSKLCPILCRSRARLCPISFAPAPFPNLAGTLWHTVSIMISVKFVGTDSLSCNIVGRPMFDEYVLSAEGSVPQAGAGDCQ